MSAIAYPPSDSTPKLRQKDLILARLLDTPGVWVPMPELAQAASPEGNGAGLAVHSRITNLREDGHLIEHRRRPDPSGPSGRYRSFYRIVVGEAVAP